MLLDNSLSMGYQQVGGTLLDEAKRKAKTYLDRLPEGSRISVVALCGGPRGNNAEVYSSKDDAREAIDAVAVVDRAVSSSRAAVLASDACRPSPRKWRSG